MDSCFASNHPESRTRIITSRILSLTRSADRAYCLFVFLLLVRFDGKHPLITARLHAVLAYGTGTTCFRPSQLSTYSLKRHHVGWESAIPAEPYPARRRLNRKIVNKHQMLNLPCQVRAKTQPNDAKKRRVFKELREVWAPALGFDSSSNPWLNGNLDF